MVVVVVVFIAVVVFVVMGVVVVVVGGTVVAVEDAVPVSNFIKTLGLDRSGRHEHGRYLRGRITHGSGSRSCGQYWSDQNRDWIRSHGAHHHSRRRPS